VNIAQFFIEQRVTTLVLTVVMIGAGLVSYQGLSRLEDPEFTIKDALVITSYPGASAAEVEKEISDPLEISVQKMGQVKRVVSRSERGLSTLTVTMKDKYDKFALPQVWDELRRKIGDAKADLPPGAGVPLVIDDYGDVYGIFVAVYGEGYTYAELKDVVDMLRRELLLVEGVGKIDTFGERVEAVYVELKRDHTIVIIEHDMRFLFALADRISVIHWGQIVAEGTPAELRANKWVQASNLGQLQ
jgi:multidrug efflux pump subunit AcrB